MLKVFLLIISLSLVLAQINPNRLASNVYPTAYKLTIDTQKAFDGNFPPFIAKIEIKLNVQSVTNQLTINSINLYINEAKLYEVRDAGNIEIPITLEEWYPFEQIDVIMNNENDVFEIGKNYVLAMEYDSYVNDVAEGLYIKQGRTNDGTRISVLTTNLVPISARQLFPCYDEPKFKATYELTIVHASKYSALGNMPIKESTDVAGVTTTTFEMTPPLSPHSFGFVVTEFDKIESNTNGKFIAYYDQSHDKEEVSLVLEASGKILNALELYLDTSVGVPEIKDVPQFDYAKAKIGSLGLVLNDMRYYYINSTSTKFQYDEVVRHVSRLMADQFFGNLIAHEWWDDTWFTRGLAILFEYFILESEYPEYKSMDILRARLYNNFYDGVPAFREVDMVDLTRNLLTDHHAGKATEIVFMLQNILTEDIFKLALRTLLSEYRNAPVDTKLFFEVLTRVGHETGALPTNYDFNTIMPTWIKAAGSPILKVSRNYDTGVVTLTQSDYLEYVGYWLPEDKSVWWLPYNYVTENGTLTWDDRLPNGWLEEERTKDLDFETDLQSDEWILFNVKQAGFYHTIYDHMNWLLLAKQLSRDHEKIHYINRGHIVSDAFIFGYLDHITLDVAFEAANYLNNETSTFPFQILFTEEFNTIVSNVYATDVYSNFTQFMRNKIENMYNRVRVSRDVTQLDFDELTIRASITKFACHIQLEACLEDAYAVFGKYYKYADNQIFTQIAADYESHLGWWLLRYGFALTNEEEFSFMFERINNGADSSVHYKLAQIIGMCQNEAHIDRLMNILVTKNGNSIFSYTINLSFTVRYFIFETLVENNEYALDAAFLYLEDMYPAIMEIYDIESVAIVMCVLKRTTTPERFEKLIRLVEMYAIVNYVDFTIELDEIANRTVEWNKERIIEFQDVLATLLEGRSDEEIPGPVDPGDGGDGGGNSITISIFSIILSSLILICTR